MKKSLLVLPLALSGCQAIGNWADRAGRHMPVIGNPCYNWQCFTDEGQAKSEALAKEEERKPSTSVPVSDEQLANPPSPKATTSTDTPGDKPVPQLKPLLTPQATTPAPTPTPTPAPAPAPTRTPFGGPTPPSTIMPATQSTPVPPAGDSRSLPGSSYPY